MSEEEMIAHYVEWCVSEDLAVAAMRDAVALMRRSSSPVQSDLADRTEAAANTLEGRP